MGLIPILRAPDGCNVWTPIVDAVRLKALQNLLCAKSILVIDFMAIQLPIW